MSAIRPQQRERAPLIGHSRRARRCVEAPVLQRAIHAAHREHAPGDTNDHYHLRAALTS